MLSMNSWQHDIKQLMSGCPQPLSLFYQGTWKSNWTLNEIYCELMFAVWTQDLYIIYLITFVCQGSSLIFRRSLQKILQWILKLRTPTGKYSSNYHFFQGRAAKLRGHVVVTPAKHLLPPTPRVSVGKKDDPNSLGESLNDASPSRKNGYQEAFHCSGSI